MKLAAQCVSKVNGSVTTTQFFEGGSMITNPSSARIKKVCALVAKAKERKIEEKFVVEGRKMFEEAPTSMIVEVFLTEGFLKKASQEILEKLKKTGYEIVSEQVFLKLSDTKTPQGILTILRFFKHKIDEIIDIENPLFVILEGIQDPGNLGTIIRTCEGAGVNAIFMTKDTVDIYNPKVIRSTMGSIYRMPLFYIEEIEKLIRELQKKEVKIYATHLSDSVDFNSPDYRKGTAFLIGNEGNGLKDETAKLSDLYIKIPMHGAVESLNASIATALVIYEACMQRR